MNKFLLKKILAAMAVTILASSFGYLAVRHLGKYMMLAISAGTIGLGIALHQTQKSSHPKLPSKTMVVTEPKTNPVKVEREVKEQHDTSVKIVSNKIKARAKTIKATSRYQSSGYCRKRLALCHRAKIEGAKKNTPEN
ncbi:hypothetical protein [Nostoc sp. MS1]|uniref:hypothetical protein n=1 Tax=Nostoc sp. MS1 TaxID=2764711 RepID=UPI001CC67632|nr:hypothetical protein [Nostoc sp. MS1]BCL33579.1 hypothetical protein NSMS1_00260 [Nostoc sp. MS1]